METNPKYIKCVHPASWIVLGQISYFYTFLFFIIFAWHGQNLFLVILGNKIATFSKQTLDILSLIFLLSNFCLQQINLAMNCCNTVIKFLTKCAILFYKNNNMG